MVGTPSKKNWLLPFTIVCVVLGGLLGIQVHGQQLRGATAIGRQTGLLVERLSRNELQLTQQSEEIERLRSKIAEYEEEAASERGLARLMSEELQVNRFAVGTIAVKGPGVELEIADSTMRVSGEPGASDVFVIHDYDLLQIANELWAAGAEAISLNGQRLRTGSAIVCSARLIEVNNVTIASPFIFKAIGNKDKLVSALNIRDGVLDGLRVLQFPVKLTSKDEIVIPPAMVAPVYEYAQPVEKGEKR